MLFICGVIVGVCLMSIFMIFKFQDEKYYESVLSEILRTCRPSKKAGREALMRAQILLNEMKG